jgi:hypothetical protein
LPLNAETRAALAQYIKRATLRWRTVGTDVDGLEEIRTSCASIGNGVSSCVSDIDGDLKHGQIILMMVKDQTRGIVAQSYIDRDKFMSDKN